MAITAGLEQAKDLGIRIARVEGSNSPFLLWLAYAEPVSPEALNLLSRSERVRADRFHSSWLRHRYVTGHCALRLVLERCFGIAADRQSFEVGRLGKPQLIGMSHAQFSISYSGDRILIGAARGVCIGVDIERLRPVEGADDLALHHFTPGERAQLESRRNDRLSRDAMFLEVWTRKEALVKATGMGVAEVDLTQIESGAGCGTARVRLGSSELCTGSVSVDAAYTAAWAVAADNIIAGSFRSQRFAHAI